LILMLKKKILALLFFLFVFLFSSKFVYAKDYSILSADFKVQLNLDGSAGVTETRAYYFDGSFSWIDQTINLNTKYKIQNTNFELWEGLQKYLQSDSGQPGTYQLTITPEKLYLKAYYQANFESKTFTLKYKIENAIINHDDIAEFYWQLIGGEWSKPHQKVTAEVILPLPAPDDQIWAFGHGPLNGRVSIPDNQRAVFSADNLPINKFFEVRVLFPKLENAVFAQTGNKTLAGILDEEKKDIEKTAKDVNKKNISPVLAAFGVLFGIGVNFLFVIAIIRYLVLRRKYGMGAKLPEANLSGTLHEPPSELPPAMVEGLLKGGVNYSPSVFLATILSLVQRRIIKIKSEPKKTFFGKTGYEYSLVKAEKYGNEKLLDFEKDLLEFVFSGADEVSFKQIKKDVQSSPTISSKFFLKFKKNSYEELLTPVRVFGFKENLLEKVPKEYRKNGYLLFIIYFILQVVSIFFGFFPGIFNITLNLIIICVIVKRFPFAEKRTQTGLKETAAWKAFNKWLKDYSVTKNYPVDSIILWEKYLVYGTLFGVSIKTLASLPVSFSAEEFNRLATTYYGVTIANMSDFSGSLSKSFSGMSSSFSNSFSGGYGSHGVGSSGGFSGGGGGGGGGGAG